MSKKFYEFISVSTEYSGVNLTSNFVGCTILDYHQKLFVMVKTGSLVRYENFTLKFP